MPLPAERINRLPRYVFDVIGETIRQMQQQGIDVYRLDIGNPDMPPPDEIVNALETSARNPRNHGYSGYRGIPAFRKAVAAYYQRRYNVTLNPDTEVLPLLGSKEGIVNLSLAYLDRGDIALVPDTGYPSYSMGTYLAGADVEWLPTRAKNGFLPDWNHVSADVLNRAKLLWVNYPNNPTGAVADLAFYERAIEFCKANNLLLVSDNPYNEVVFDNYIAPSPLQLDGAKEHTVELISLSKTYNMAGWRIGAAVGSAEALSLLLQVKSNVDSGHFVPVYEAAAHAMNTIPDSWIQERNAIYQKRRDKVVATLSKIGLEAQTPQATLYIWAKPVDMKAPDYIQRALQEAHVSFGPGAAYGPGGEDYIRIAISVPDERLDGALESLVKWYQSL